MSNLLITSLPLCDADRTHFVECAERVFENVLARMEPSNPERIRTLWNAESYVATLLNPDILPIQRDYALSLSDVFLVHHVLDLATRR